MYSEIVAPELDRDPRGDVPARTRRTVRSIGLSQAEIARRIGMDATALSKALHGTRRFRDPELKAIARLGKVPVDYLRTGSGGPPESLAEPMRAPPRQRADIRGGPLRRAQILEATARLIARMGFHRVRVSDIARECGTSTATVHYHVDSKEATLRAALRFYADRLHAQLELRIQHSGDTVEILRGLIELQLPSSAADMDEWSVWVQFWCEAMLHPTLREEHQLVYGRWQTLVVDLLVRCQDEGLAPDADIDALSRRFTGMVDGLAIQVITGACGMTVDRMRELLLDAFEPHISLR